MLVNADVGEGASAASLGQASNVLPHVVMDRGEVVRVGFSETTSTVKVAWVDQREEVEVSPDVGKLALHGVRVLSDTHHSASSA